MKRGTECPLRSCNIKNKVMSKKHFIVSIKTIDDMRVFPSNFNGETFLLGATAKVGAKTGGIFKGYASFPTGLELVLYCKDVQEARRFADEIANAIYIKTNSIGHIIPSFGIHIGELTDDERTLEAVMMDMMIRSMAARGLDFGSIPTISIGLDDKQLS